MARIIPVGEPENDAERRVIAHLRDHAPDQWTVLHNVELPRRGQRYEVDLIVITPHAVYVIDTKGTHGLIEVVRNKWYPKNRQPFTSPVPKLRQNAKALNGILTQRSALLNQLFVDALVVLEADDANLFDPDDRDTDHVVKLSHLVETLADTSRIPSHFDTSGLGTRSEVVEAVAGSAKPPSGPKQFGNWRIIEELGGNDSYTEYRARHATIGNFARLKVFRLDPYLDTTARKHQGLRFGNAYATLHKLPPHRHIVPALDFFPVDDHAGVLVLGDTPGDALRVLLNRPDTPLSMDVKLLMLRGITSALAHAHAHHVIHRALSPDTVLSGSDHHPILTGFDHARHGELARPYTVVGTVPSVVDSRYIAPEAHDDPAALDKASDIYSLGVLAFELFTGEPPFSDGVAHYRNPGRIPEEDLSAIGVCPELITWITSLCAPDPKLRPAAHDSQMSLDRAIARQKGLRGPGPREVEKPVRNPLQTLTDNDWDALRNLGPDHQLTAKYTVRRKLGSGSFGVVYLVHDVLARTDRVLKLVLQDEDSVVNRLLQEYRNLLDLPAHPNVVRARDADFLRDRIPFLVMEHVPGKDLGELMDSGGLGPADVHRLGSDIARGLKHIHAHGVHHCDIKPRNLLWGEQGGVIIDFNVAVGAEQSLSEAGLSKKYLPPDLDPAKRPSPADLVDRDVYALGLSLYEALTGTWPWPVDALPPAHTSARDPRTISGTKDLDDLSAEFTEVLLRAIEPSRADRYSSADEFLRALNGVRSVRVPQTSSPSAEGEASFSGDHSPFVSYLQTLYSQSPKSNSGTRGLDQLEFDIYVPTALDEHLIPDVLGGQHRLVVITGNAGDGKTAFLERLVKEATADGAELGPPRGNGHDFALRGRTFRTNLDGSQDEGDRDNDDVLSSFFSPYRGADPQEWPTDETRLIAVNEGRLVDFLTANRVDFPLLLSIVGDQDSAQSHGVALVNLNTRSVVVRPRGAEGQESASIFDRVLDNMTGEKYWSACSGCALADKCYALHNARTFAHPTAGPRVSARLRGLYELSHLRGKLHITLRDLRSALAYTLTSGRDCSQIHDLYERGDAEEILSGFYFNSWAGPPEGTQDRLMSLLRESDVSASSDPGLDRRLDFIGPSAGSRMMTLDQRGDYDHALLSKLFRALPRGSAAGEQATGAHRSYVRSARRRYFFETQDGERASALLPYRSAEEFESELADTGDSSRTVRQLVRAINRGEGLADPDKLGDALALAVRQVKEATIRSYRLFPLDRFTLEPAGPRGSRYVESGPDRLLLRFLPEESQATDAMLAHPPELAIRLDLFEMLHRLGYGGFPSHADVQGHHLSLTVFKNMLTAAPYQEILLTVTGHRVHRVTRSPDGVLTMAEVRGDTDNPDEE